MIERAQIRNFVACLLNRALFADWMCRRCARRIYIVKQIKPI